MLEFSFFKNYWLTYFSFLYNLKKEKGGWINSSFLKVKGKVKVKFYPYSYKPLMVYSLKFLLLF